MRVNLTYDARVRAWVFDNSGLVVASGPDLERLETQLAVAFGRITEPRSDFLVSIDGMRIAPELSGTYGAIAKKYLVSRCRRVVRYGTDLQAIVAMRSAATKNGFASSIAVTREQAAGRLLAVRRENAA